MEKIETICLHKIFGSSCDISVKVEGVGDCKTCIKDENNKYCRCYYPITIYNLDVGGTNGKNN